MEVRSVVVSLIAILLAVHSAEAQRWTNREGEPPLNPNSGQPMDPTFLYDPVDGLFYIDNVGSNQIVDSTDNSFLQGDDTGLIRLTLFGNFDQVESVFPLFVDGIAWAVSLSDDGVELQGNAIAAAFLPIATEPTAIFQLEPGLGANDFRDSVGVARMEVFSAYTFQGCGRELLSTGDALQTGALQIVPEPAGLSLMLILGLGIFARIRR